MEATRSSLQIWVMAARPKTLTAAVIPVLVGTALAANEGAPLSAALFLWALFGALFIQIGTNFVNDAMDFKKGTDTAERLGPTRTAQSGLLSPSALLKGAYFCFFAALVCGAPLVAERGWPLLLIGFVSIAAAYAYTGGPYPLAYLGLGDIFVILFFGLVAVGGSFYLQAGHLSRGALVAGLALGFLATVLLAVNNLRDIDGDRKNHKRTLAVRFGAGFARVEIALLALAPFASGFYWWSLGFRWAALLPLLALPLCAKLLRIALTTKGSALNASLAKAAGLHALYGALLSLGLWLG